ncbi:MAG: hypothetical protein ACRD22_07625 [Terriglobia bacterium]
MPLTAGMVVILSGGFAALPLAVREAYGFPANSRTVNEVRRGVSPPDLKANRIDAPEWRSHSAQRAAEPQEHHEKLDLLASGFASLEN